MLLQNTVSLPLAKVSGGRAYRLGVPGQKKQGFGFRVETLSKGLMFRVQRVWGLGFRGCRVLASRV